MMPSQQITIRALVLVFAFGVSEFLCTGDAPDLPSVPAKQFATVAKVSPKDHPLSTISANAR
jgi:hypothetical protein